LSVVIYGHRMSMALLGKALTAERADALMSEPALIEELLWDDEQDTGAGDESAPDLDKAWHGVHFRAATLFSGMRKGVWY
jgi:hypothetical protein